ncbi:hypothetical protein AAP_01066 [Ascosphaera apis ARSEF 7405]|uniref:Uncharacterized protein n=1 Tax=Ascosphaera apis ARSEF 7405 TaxID=392613 RepID=A0A162IP63_9EURO|nr:hypothetical protein AAP_01066 [Ascosphaera apis ARSEF 7405]
MTANADTHIDTDADADANLDPYEGVKTFDSTACDVYEANGLYIVLHTPERFKGAYLWGLLIATSEHSGFFMTQYLIEDKWCFSGRMVAMEDVEGLVVAMRVGRFDGVDEKWIAAIKKCVGSARPKGDFTDRSWTLQAIYDLADSGFIDLFPKWPEVFKIEGKILAVAGERRSGPARYILNYEPS